MKNASGDLRELIDNKENCRRSTILRALGSGEERQPDRIACCDVCGTEQLPPALQAVFPSSASVTAGRSRARTVPRRVRDELRAALIAARDQIVDLSIGFKMLGTEVVCSTKVINDVCKNVAYIESVEDLKIIKGLRTDLYHHFYNVILEVLPSRIRRKRRL